MRVNFLAKRESAKFTFTAFAFWRVRPAGDQIASVSCDGRDGRMGELGRRRRKKRTGALWRWPCDVTRARRGGRRTRRRHRRLGRPAQQQPRERLRTPSQRQRESVRARAAPQEFGTERPPICRRRRLSPLINWVIRTPVRRRKTRLTTERHLTQLLYIYICIGSSA